MSSLLFSMYFVGIDLAWSPKNSTGIAIIAEKNNKANLVDARVLQTDKEIIDYVNKFVGDKNAFIAIDAPLDVPNNEGRRPAEDVTSKLFRKYNAGAHPSNRNRFLQWADKIRGEQIVRLLKKENFKHDPNTKEKEQSRKVFEVFPHPSMVVLFNLDKVIPYKAKPKRDYEFRYNAFKKYQKHLSELKDLILPKDIIEKNVSELKAKKLKEYEDLLDGVFCAYIAYYVWKQPNNCAILGNTKEGYILTPVFDHMHKEIDCISKQTRLAPQKTGQIYK